MPRTPKNPGSGKAPSNTPSRGPGHGGPAKGFVPNPHPSSPQNLKLYPPARGPDNKLLLSPKSKAAEAAAQEALGKMYTIMTTSTFEGNQKDAAVALMNRIWGMSAQKVDGKVEMSWADMVRASMKSVDGEGK